MTVGATDDEIKWQLGGQLATSEYRMFGGMYSSDHDYYFWNKKCQEQSVVMLQVFVACIDSLGMC